MTTFYDCFTFMKVIATQPGMYGIHLHQPGDSFEIADLPQGLDGKPLAFSATWMRPMEPFPVLVQHEKTAKDRESWERLKAFLKKDIRKLF